MGFKPPASPGSSATPARVDVGGNLGGSYAIDATGKPAIWAVNAILNADCTVTISNLPAGTCAQVRVIGAKDNTGTPHTLSINDGNGASSIVTLTTANQPFEVVIDWDGTTATAYLAGATNGTNGTNGADGRTILTTSGAPANATGNDGDYAIDPTAKLLYGPKVSGAWPAGVSLQGTAATDVQVFTASGTWNKPSGASAVRVVCIGPGGGGGSGRRGAAGTVRTGGNGGAGGAFTERILAAANLGTTEAVTVNAGGAGAPAATANDTNGSNGSPGGAATSFGTKVRASGGFGGSAGSTGGSAAVTGGSGAFAGGNGGSNSATGGPGTAAPATGISATGGGAGGGITSADVASAGGTGGQVAGGQTAVGASGAINSNGGVGAAGIGTNAAACGTGAGGGGSSLTGAGGNGGNGGQYGAGGGGGGASLNGNNSGAGGAGGDGICVVISW